MMGVISQLVKPEAETPRRRRVQRFLNGIHLRWVPPLRIFRLCASQPAASAPCKQRAQARFVYYPHVLLLMFAARAASAPLESDFYETPSEALFFACMTGDVERAAAALTAGAAVDARNAHGITPLLVACGGVGPADLVRLLLTSGASADGCDAQGWTPLVYAASSGQLALMNELLSAGADVNAQGNNGGWTPLARAAFRGHPLAITLLISAGAHADQIAEGRTPRAWAEAGGHDDAVRAFDQ